jgi:hypothetical protein
VVHHVGYVQVGAGAVEVTEYGFQAHHINVQVEEEARVLQAVQFGDCWSGQHRSSSVDQLPPLLLRYSPPPLNVVSCMLMHLVAIASHLRAQKHARTHV